MSTQKLANILGNKLQACVSIELEDGTVYGNCSPTGEPINSSPNGATSNAYLDRMIKKTENRVQLNIHKGNIQKQLDDIAKMSQNLASHNEHETVKMCERLTSIMEDDSVSQTKEIKGMYEDTRKAYQQALQSTVGGSFIPPFAGQASAEQARYSQAVNQLQQQTQSDIEHKCALVQRDHTWKLSLIEDEYNKKMQFHQWTFDNKKRSLEDSRDDKIRQIESGYSDDSRKRSDIEYAQQTFKTELGYATDSLRSSQRHERQQSTQSQKLSHDHSFRHVRSDAQKHQSNQLNKLKSQHLSNMNRIKANQAAHISNLKAVKIQQEKRMLERKRQLEEQLKKINEEEKILRERVLNKMLYKKMDIRNSLQRLNWCEPDNRQLEENKYWVYFNGLWANVTVRDILSLAADMTPYLRFAKTIAEFAMDNNKSVPLYQLFLPKLLRKVGKAGKKKSNYREYIDPKDGTLKAELKVGGSLRKWSERFPHRQPRNALEKKAFDAAYQDKGVRIIKQLKDPRFKGMSKYRVSVKEGQDSAVVHYVKDLSNRILDVKFK